MNSQRTIRQTKLWLAAAGVWVACFVGMSTADAHLMVAQHGTLNFVGGGAYFVVSFPVSALVGVDDDADGRISGQELKTHRKAIEAQVRKGFQLVDDRGPRAVRGLLINSSSDHGKPGEPVDQLVAMGRFDLPSTKKPVKLRTTLFGKTEAEKTVTIRVRRHKELQSVVLRAAKPEHTLFRTPLR